MAWLRAALAPSLVGCTLVSSTLGCESSGGTQGTVPDASSQEGGAVEAGQSAPEAGVPGATLEAGTGTLTGSQAFGVGSVINVYSAQDCSGNAFADAGVRPAANIFFLPSAISPSALCDVDAAAPDAGSSIVMALQIATPEWAMYAPAPLTQSLTPGTYTISNEHQDDEDLCMLAPGGTAILLIYPPGGESLWVATSGTVTLTTVTATSVAGSFHVVLTPQFPDAGVSAPSLSGSFNAAACP
jgi:hypothetical protein